jgi:tetratricopeptide (TPR) repeat protein
MTLFANPSEEAYEAYLLGEQAIEREERELYFNKALKQYSMISPKSAQLYFNIGNCYYQLDQGPIAIWYYQKAKALDPRNQRIEDNLHKALVKAQIEPSSMRQVLSRLFFFHTLLLSHEKELMFYFFSVFVFILGSLFIWLNHSFLKTTAGILLVPLLALGVSLGIDRIQFSSKAILVHPSLLRCDAGKQYGGISDEIELAGQTVQIIEFSKDENWVKIKTSKKKVGYVLKEKVKPF